MKYAFVSISIIVIWFAIILIVYSLEQSGIFLPLTALVMTMVLFYIGFGGKNETFLIDDIFTKIF